MPVEEVFQTLRCNTNGLTTEAARERLAIFGYNKLEEKKVFLFTTLSLIPSLFRFVKLERIRHNAPLFLILSYI